MYKRDAEKKSRVPSLPSEGKESKAMVARWPFRKEGARDATDGFEGRCLIAVANRSFLVGHLFQRFPIKKGHGHSRLDLSEYPHIYTMLLS